MFCRFSKRIDKLKGRMSWSIRRAFFSLLLHDFNTLNSFIIFYSILFYASSIQFMYMCSCIDCIFVETASVLYFFVTV